MARPSPELVAALRTTADRLERGARYRWTHMGSCNCGHLAQTLTRVSPEALHRMALEKAGDWSEQAIDHCPESGHPIDHVIETILAVGLDRQDLVDLERLSGRAVLGRLPAGRRTLDRRDRAHVILYMRAWADLLEEAWAGTAIPALAGDGLHRTVDEKDKAPV